MLAFSLFPQSSVRTRTHTISKLQDKLLRDSEETILSGQGGLKVLDCLISSDSKRSRYRVRTPSTALQQCQHQMESAHRLRRRMARCWLSRVLAGQADGCARQWLGEAMAVLCRMIVVLGEGSTGVGPWPCGTRAVQGAVRVGQRLTRDPVCLKTLKQLWL